MDRTAPLFFFFFNDTATTEIYTLSLHDALPISFRRGSYSWRTTRSCIEPSIGCFQVDRKSTRLNSSHSQISYAVFCLKKKKQSDLPHPTGEGNAGIPSSANQAALWANPPQSPSP